MSQNLRIMTRNDPEPIYFNSADVNEDNNKCAEDYAIFSRILTDCVCYPFLIAN